MRLHHVYHADCFYVGAIPSVRLSLGKPSNPPLMLYNPHIMGLGGGGGFNIRGKGSAKLPL